MRLVCLLVLSFGLLAACTPMAHGPAFDKAYVPPIDKAVVYFYRPDKGHPPWEMVRIYGNGELVTELPVKGFYRFEAIPGCYKFKARWSSYYWLEPWLIFYGDIAAFASLLGGRPYAKTYLEAGHVYYLAYQEKRETYVIKSGFYGVPENIAQNTLEWMRLVPGRDDARPLETKQIQRNRKNHQMNKSRSVSEKETSDDNPCGW